MNLFVQKLRTEATAIVGFGLVIAGIWQIHQPSALVVAGVILLADRFATYLVIARKPLP